MLRLTFVKIAIVAISHPSRLSSNTLLNHTSQQFSKPERAKERPYQRSFIPILIDTLVVANGMPPDKASRLVGFVYSTNMRGTIKTLIKLSSMGNKMSEYFFVGISLMSGESTLLKYAALHKTSLPNSCTNQDFQALSEAYCCFDPAVAPHWLSVGLRKHANRQKKLLRRISSRAHANLLLEVLRCPSPQINTAGQVFLKECRCACALLRP